MGGNSVDLGGSEASRRRAPLLRAFGWAYALETNGNPLAYGEWLGAPGKATIVIYGHYDVQPADAIELWHSPPFEATVRDGNLYGRGSVDDKGQVLMHLAAIEAQHKDDVCAVR